MRFTRLTPLILAASSALTSLCFLQAHAASRVPNIVFILADDLGYGDLGCFGQTKIKTPNLDRMAAEGMRFTNHYSGNAVCAPSRCVLMTGLHPGHAFIRDNREMKPEGQFPITAATLTLAEMLKKQGYTTGGFGKWGLGGPGTTGEPTRQGFDRFYGYNCQAVAHNYYPTYLWDNDSQASLKNDKFSAHQKFPEGLDPKDPKNYERYKSKEYSPDLIADEARKFLRENKDKPFFLYWPTTVPHLALQVPDDSLGEYIGKFEDEPYLGDRGYLPHRYPHAAYAAMITRMDREVGKAVALIKELGLDENTIFIFSSDNGPLYDKLGGTDCEFFNSNGGLRGRKGSLYEGGFREPCIVRWSGKIKAGTQSDRVTGFEDWAPTLHELIGAKASTPAGLDGISFAPTLLGEQQPPREFLYREFPAYDGQQCVRVGDWKAVRQNLMPRRKKGGKAAPAPVIKTELYNLKEDPAESKNVATGHPDVLMKLEAIMKREHVNSPDFPLPAIDAK